jgi:hypothetical protein
MSRRSNKKEDAKKPKKKEPEVTPPVSYLEQFEQAERKMLASLASREDWVRVLVKGPNLYDDKYKEKDKEDAEHVLLLRTSTPLSAVASDIRRRHGLFTNLKLFRFSVLFSLCLSSLLRYFFSFSR